MNVYKRCHLVCLVFFLLVNEVNAANREGHYEIIYGANSKVCQEYVKTINMFYKRERDALCGIGSEYSSVQFSPSSPFSSPTWKKIEKPSIELSIEMIKMFQTSSSTVTEERLNSWYDSPPSKHIYFTHIDIDNDGNFETVIKFNEMDCGVSRAYAAPIFVVDENMQHIDIDKSPLLFQNYNYRENGGRHVKGSRNLREIAGDYLYKMYSIFLYKNKYYFDVISGRQELTRFLEVFKTEKEQTTRVCKFKFKYHRNQNQ